MSSFKLMVNVMFLLIAGVQQSQAQVPKFLVPSSDIVFHVSIRVGNETVAEVRLREGSMVYVRSDEGLEWAATMTLQRGENAPSNPPRYLVETFGQGLEVSITADKFHFGDFRDGAFVTELWRMKHKNPQTWSDGIERSLVSLYGPTSNACFRCGGSLICATEVKRCDE